ncbi:MAG: glycosyltransferase family A protein [Bacillota bacterium]
MPNTIHTFVVLAYKESPYLESCIQSVIQQSYPSQVVIATSTPNRYIQKIANQYYLPIIVNEQAKHTIGDDFDFARTCVDSELVTIAHQDDIYEKDYAKTIVNAYKNNHDAIILFSNYFEIRNNKRVYENTNLKIKRKLLSCLRLSSAHCKRWSISLGNSICCPAVTYHNKLISYNKIFDSNYKSNVDWFAWEKLSRLPGRFIFIDYSLMGHRVHEESTTTQIIEDNARTNEDLDMLKKFWPSSIAKLINHLYKNAEKSNIV